MFFLSWKIAKVNEPTQNRDQENLKKSDTRAFLDKEEASSLIRGKPKCI